MPNHCENQLIISGPEEEVARCLKFIEGEPIKDYNGNLSPNLFECDNVIPYPENFKKMDAESDGHGAGFNAGGYEWCIANWGTKWGAYDTYLAERGEGSVQIDFNSAWSPPSPVVEKLASLFPQLSITLQYEEPGCDFSGFEMYQDGEVISSNTGSYNDFPISDHSWMDEDELDEMEEEDAEV